VRDWPKRRVLLVVGHRPLIVAGGGSLQDELLRTAGGINVAADAGAAFPQVPLELVVSRAPDVILDAAMGSEAGGHELFQGLDTVPAVRDGRIVTLEPDALFRAGPRVGEAAAMLANAIHPEAAGS
jgi:iron complex transport system substrate-binding protein